MQAFPSQRVQSFVNRPLAGVQKPLEYESSNPIQLPPALYSFTAPPMPRLKKLADPNLLQPFFPTKCTGGDL
jgi:hypothetical protein